MALPKYKDIMALAKDKVQEFMAPLRANEMKKKGELEICKIDGSIAEQEQKIQELCAEYPVNYDRIIDAIDELDLMNRRKEQFAKIIDELFS